MVPDLLIFFLPWMDGWMTENRPLFPRSRKTARRLFPASRRPPPGTRSPGMEKDVSGRDRSSIVLYSEYREQTLSFEKITIPPIDISANLFHDPRVFDSSFPFRRMERGVNNRRGQAIDRAEWKENPSIKRVYIYIYSNNSRMLICEFSRIHLRNRKIWRNNKTIRGIGQLEAWWLSIDESFFSTSRFQGLTQGCTIDAVPRTNRRLYTLPYP